LVSCQLWSHCDSAKWASFSSNRGTPCGLWAAPLTTRCFSVVIVQATAMRQSCHGTQHQPELMPRHRALAVVAAFQRVPTAPPRCGSCTSMAGILAQNNLRSSLWNCRFPVHALLESRFHWGHFFQAIKMNAFLLRSSDAAGQRLKSPTQALATTPAKSDSHHDLVEVNA